MLTTRSFSAKLLTTLAVGAMLVPIGSALSVSNVLSEGFYVVTDTPDGVKVEFVSELDAIASCGGRAPVDTTCENQGVRTGFYLSHGFAFPAMPETGDETFVGYAHSELVGSDGRTRVFGCDVQWLPNRNPSFSCAGSGAFPTVGASLVQTGTVSGYGAARELSAAVGDWQAVLRT